MALHGQERTPYIACRSCQLKSPRRVKFEEGHEEGSLRVKPAPFDCSNMDSEGCKRTQGEIDATLGRLVRNRPSGIPPG